MSYYFSHKLTCIEMYIYAMLCVILNLLAPVHFQFDESLIRRSSLLYNVIMCLLKYSLLKPGVSLLSLRLVSFNVTQQSVIE